VPGLYIGRVIGWKEDSGHKRNSICCCFCSKQETIQHIFFYCPMARMMWNSINVTFDVRKPVNTDKFFWSLAYKFFA
jgi:hypothetical protein